MRGRTSVEPKGGEQVGEVSSWLAIAVFLCEVHLIAIILRESFQLLCPDVVKGLLYTALAVSTGEAMQGFRAALFEEILETLDIMEGVPTREAVAYRNECINLFSNHLDA